MLLTTIIYGGLQIRRQLSLRSTLGRATDFPSGSVTAFDLRSTLLDPDAADPAAAELSPVPIYLVHVSEDEFLALLRRDPDSGCDVEWEAAGELFRDPCNDSTYNLRGERLSGPARRGLDRFPVIHVGRGNLQVNVELFQIGPTVP